MDLEKIKKQIAELKKKVIVEVNKHFNEFILMELDETGDDDYFLIDSLSWSIYWVNRLVELKEIMDLILNERDKKEDNKPYLNELNDCIKLKRIIDENIIKYGLKEKDELNLNINWVYDNLDIPRSNKYRKTKPIGIQVGLDVIENLHRNLKQKGGYISVDYEEFIKHFIETKNEIPPIVWNDDELPSLIVFVKLLYQSKILKEIYNKPINQRKLIKDHFKIEGVSFNEKVLRSTQSKYVKLWDTKHFRELKDFVFSAIK